MSMANSQKEIKGKSLVELAELDFAVLCAVRKAVVFSGGVTHPATGSLQPVAIGATKRKDRRRSIPRKRAVKRFSEWIGRNASERRAGLEMSDAGADPTELRGRLPLRSTCRKPKAEGTSDSASRPRRGGRRQHVHKGNDTQHGKLRRWRRVTANETPARDRLGRVE
jgi:hypothetical protein